MALDLDPVRDFRTRVSLRAKQSEAQWQGSRHVVDSGQVASTLTELRRALEAAPLPPAVRQKLDEALPTTAQHIEDLSGDALRQLTGWSGTKGLRALCVYFGLVPHPASRWPVPRIRSEALEQLLSRSGNPFDVLLDVDVPSVLELGAGDLSFARELADRYGSVLRDRGRPLILHCLDRLHPGSQLGGPLHASSQVVRHLETQLGSTFGFHGDQDMFTLSALDERGKLAPEYAIVACWAPATPTFAYEPSRLSQAGITADLRRTKGEFRLTRMDGETALEVDHGGRTLLFPPWKFDIRGPLALLRLMADRGKLAILGAVDGQVFWELLAQLLDDERFRPRDVLFTAETLPQVFGDVHRALERLPVGSDIDLADLGRLRTRWPWAAARAGGETPRAPFRRIWIRRGERFADSPASSTARTFAVMSEESTPWCLVLLRDDEEPARKPG